MLPGASNCAWWYHVGRALSDLQFNASPNWVDVGLVATLGLHLLDAAWLLSGLQSADTSDALCVRSGSHGNMGCWGALMGHRSLWLVPVRSRAVLPRSVHWDEVAY